MSEHDTKKILKFRESMQQRVKELQRNRTSIITQGWVNMIKKFIEDEPLSEDNIRTLMGHFDRLLLLDYGATPLTDEEILFFYDLVQVPIEMERADVKYFQDILNRLLGYLVRRKQKIL